jgi:cell division transport system permease protein
VSVLAYSLQEALASLRRGGRGAVMSMGTIAIAFLALGGFVLVTTNLQRMAERWMDAAEMSVYLDDEASEAARAAVGEHLRQQAEVLRVDPVSKDEALARFRSDFPELADVAAGLDGNPFPASFEVRLRPGAEVAERAAALAASVSGLDGVADVQFDRRWVERVLSIIAGLRLGGLAVALVLLLGAAFTVSAVVRLSLHARRDELDIMQLVGAPFGFIRGPFVVEGLLLGGLGATLALVALLLLFTGLRGWMGEELAALLGTGAVRFIGVAESGLVLAAGLAVGALAGAVASRAAR